jgi:hypothetical protein
LRSKPFVFLSFFPPNQKIIQKEERTAIFEIQSRPSALIAYILFDFATLEHVPSYLKRRYTVFRLNGVAKLKDHKFIKVFAVFGGY